MKFPFALRRAWWFTLLSALVLVSEGMSAISRGARGKSDLGVFYRTAVLLLHGADGALYAGRDALLGWYRCIPPTGMMWFAPFATLSPRGASIGWVVLNLVFAGVGAFAVRAILKRAANEEGWSASETLPWALGLFFLMSAPSLEVGQFSLMFAACWLLVLWCAARNRFDGAAIVLALPAAIKIYPALLLLAPLGVLAPKKWPRFIAVFALGFAFWTWGAPSLFYGGRTISLQSAFWHDVVLSPAGRLSESQGVSASSSHGLDTVLLRFLSSTPEPKGAPPHLNFDPQQVLRFVNPLRALLVLGAIMFWLCRARSHEMRAWLDSFALWSATLFLILPGAKARYAVYAFAAFLPLLLHALSLFEHKSKKRWTYCAFIALALVLSMSLVSESVRLWGAGFWGALLLWLENGRLLRSNRTEKAASYWPTRTPV